MHHRVLLLHLQCHGEITLTEQRASNLLTAFWHELCPALGLYVFTMLQRPCWDGAEQGTKLRSLIFLISEAELACHDFCTDAGASCIVTTE